MFKSATLKLTGWYVLTMMIVSIIFSVVVYQFASSELTTRIDNLHTGLEASPDFVPQNSTFYQVLRAAQLHKASINLIVSLIYANLVVLAAAGVGGYILARRTLQPIEAAHDAQSRFVSDASHELRTPLAVMKTELEVALRDPELAEDDMHELLHSNLEEVEKLTKLSQTLLSLSRLDYESLEHERVNLTKLVHEVVTRYDKSGSRLKLSEPGRALIVDAHQPSIEELLTILIDNALKYSPEDSLVHIKLSRRNGKAAFQISNDGKGIRARDLPHIFDRFYRADNSRTHGASTSFGLGLSLAKTIVEIHHGELTVSSAPGKTTTFTVLLPIVKSSTARLSGK